MFLKDILKIYPIYINIIKYLTDTDIDILCNTSKKLKKIFMRNGFKRHIQIYYDNINKYITCLEEFEKHKSFVKEISGYHMNNPFLYLPKCESNVKYNLYF